MPSKKSQSKTIVKPPAVEEASTLVHLMVLALVDDPANVSVTVEPLERGYTLHVQTDPDDIGKIIGKEGRTARSIRNILTGIGKKAGTQFHLNIIQPERALYE